MTIIGPTDSRISTTSVFPRSRFEPPRAGEALNADRRRSRHQTSKMQSVRRVRQMMFGAVISCAMGLAACGGGGGGASVDLVPVATKVQVSTNGFSFPNFPASAYETDFSADDVVSMFGSGPAVCVGGKAEGCQLTAEAAAFARMVNQSRASGHCEGLAVVALNRFDTAAEPPTVKLPDKEETIRAIMRAFATQFIPEAQSEIESWLGKSLEEKIAALVESFKQDKLSFTLGVYIDSGGHTVMPYAVEFPTKDTARIMVYDTNWPAKNRYVDVDLKAKTWSFSFSGEDPANDPDMWTGGPADMDLTSFSSRAGTCPFCGDGTKTDTTTMLVRTTNLDWSVEADGQVLAPGVDPVAGSGVVVKPVKGGLLTELGFVGMRDKRATYDYMIRIPNKPAKPGAKKARSKLKFSGTTSLFAVTPTGIAQVNTPGNPNIPVEVGENSIVSKDPAVQLTLASGNLVATASGPSASLETSASGNLEVAVTAANGQVVTQAVTPEAPAAKVVADTTGGVVALVASTTGEVVKREVSSTGVETKTTTTESLDLNATTFKAPPGLESKPIEALPSLEKRNLANPEYKADAPYVAPTTTTTIAVKANAPEPKKTVVSKFVVETVEFGDAPFALTEPISNSSAPFTYTSSDPTVATVNSTTGRVTIVGVGSTMLTATQEASATYTSSTITTFFRVAKATPKVGVFTVPKKSFGDAAFSLTPPTSSNPAAFTFDSSNDAVAKVNASTGRVTIVGGGTTTITATQVASANFESVERKATLTVSKATLAFTMSAIGDTTFGTADFSLPAPNSPSNGAYTYTSLSPDVATVDNAGRVRIVGAGAASIRVAQAASANYEAATQTVAFTVRKATPRLGVFAVTSRAFGSESFSLAAPSSTSSAGFTYTSSDTSVATVASNGTVSIVGAGSTTITANQTSGTNFESASTAATFTVTKGSPTLTVTNPPDKPYGAADFTLVTPTTNSSGAMTFTSLTPTIATVNSVTGLVRLVGTGNVSIEVAVASTNNYVGVTKKISFVAQKALPTYGAFSLSTVSVSNAIAPIAPPTSSNNSPFTYTSSNPAVATVDSVTGQITLVSAGTTTITASQPATELFEASSTSSTLTVNRATPVLGSFSVSQIAFGSTPVTLTAPSSTSPGAFTYTSNDTAVATIGSDGRLTPVGPGTAVITATQAQTPLYASTDTVATVVVVKANPTYGAFTIPSKIMGAADFTISAPTSSSPASFTFESSDTTVATVTSAGVVSVIGPGTTTITASQEATNNYNASSTTAVLTVNKAAPTIGALSTLNANPADGFVGTRYVGYFADNPNWFASATPHGDTNVMTDFTWFQSPNSDYYSWEWKGTFKSAAAGTYQFCTKSDDATFIWIGETALTGATTTNALVQNGGIHGVTQRCGTTTLTANTSYPFRMVYGDGCCGDSIEMWFTINGGAAIRNGVGYYYSSQPPRVGDANFTMALPTTNSSGAMTFSSSNPSVAQVNELTGEVTVVGAGSTTITVNQAETSTYAAGSTSSVMTVDKGKQATLTAAPTTCALGGTCAVGDVGPGGGTVIYAATADFTSGASCGTNCRYLEIAPTTWNGGSSDANNQFEWGCSGTSVPGTGTGIGSGFSNTAAMATACSTATSAANIVRSITTGRRSDWYIPSQDEAEIIFVRRNLIDGYQPSSTYWTSSQSSLTNAFAQAGASEADVAKTAMNIVRPIRAFKADNLTRPFRTKVIPLIASGGSGTGQHSIVLNAAGSASCSLADGTITAIATGKCSIKVLRAGDANYLDGTSAAIELSFYGSPTTEIAASVYHTCAVTDTGNASCWGHGDWGILGNGTRTGNTEPATVNGLSTGVASLGLGQHHSCAVTSSGGVKCWGHNGNGQLGIGSSGDMLSPVDVPAVNAQIVQVVAGHQHTCALTASGGVKCWGWNGYGQLGDGTTTNKNLPVDVVGLTSGVKQIAASFGYTCALLETGRVKCWGINEHGQLGRGNNANSSVPADVSGLTSGVASISAGRYSPCAVTTTGAAKCWGHNGWGDLGTGTNASSNVPVDVLGLQSGVAKMTGGEGHNCAVMVNGALKCWGRNEQGQLGIGVTGNRNTPQDVIGLTANVSSVTAGMHQSTCAVIDGSGVKCWGYNGNGQLGDGTTTQRLVPTDVLRADGGRRLPTILGPLSLPAGPINVQSQPFTVTAPSSNREAPFRFMSSNPNVATINEATGQVTVVSAGRTILSASQAGTGAHDVATSKINLDVRPIDSTNSLTDCQMALTCNIGDIGPGGGRIFAVDTNDVFDGVDYFEAAPNDLTASTTWCDSTSASASTGGASNTDFGVLNMQSIRATCSSGAAFEVNGYTNNNVSDWYLPSRTEMANVVANVGTLTGTATAPFTPLASSTGYWSSTEASATQAVGVNSTSGTFANYAKTSNNNVRPIRAFASVYSTSIPTTLVGLGLSSAQVQYTQVPFTVTKPTSLNKWPIMYTSNNTTVATIHPYSGRVTVTGVGTATFTATQPSWGNYPATSASVTLTVIKSTPAIGGFNFTSTTIKTGSGAMSPTAPSSLSDGTYSFSSSNTQIATVNASTGAITPVSPGLVEVIATQGATSNWNSATKKVFFTIIASCADGGACVVGDTGPGGGIVFYTASARQSWGRYLEASASDVTGLHPWCDSSATDVTGAIGTAIGDGAANTAAIAAACSSSAANAVDALTQGGKSDWFLPSFPELTEMYGKKTTIGGFAAEPYWSSTQASVGAAQRIDFLDGSSVPGTTLASWRVRPIRAIVGPADGLSESTAGISATQLKIDNGYTGSGNYWIKPAGYSGPAVQLWCEFDQAGGGWALIGKGRESNVVAGGWFGTENEINVSGLTQENAFSTGVSKVSSTFVNYLMNGTANGWMNSNDRNVLLANRISNATDGYTNTNNVFVPWGGIGDSFTIKVDTSTQFKWIDQFGATGAGDRRPTVANGYLKRYSGTWLSGSVTNDSYTHLLDNFDNDARRLFTWQWGSHGGYHGWSAGQSIGAGKGFMAGNEGHAIQFVQLWAR